MLEESALDKGEQCLELLNVVTVEEAKRIISNNFKFSIGSEKVNISESTGRIIYEDIKAKENVPSFRRSTVDGYAVHSRDVFGASESMQSIMNLKGEVLMGRVPPCSIDLPGDCLYVPTGGMLPEGADSVVMIEYTEKLDDNTVLINRPVSPGENVIQAGEDISTGETVIKKGTKLRPYEIGVLSSLGVSKVAVSRKVRVGIISTGDEITGLHEVPGPGQVRDINTYMLYSSIIQDGGEPVNYGVIRDDYEALKSTVAKAVEECDVILISGGSSVGKKDQTLNVIDSMGPPGVLIHGISVKPGKPTIIGKAKAGEKIIFGLPGHPLACAVIYKVIVRHYIDMVTGFNEISYPIQCRFSINYHKSKGREEYLPVSLEHNNGEIAAVPVFGKSGLITGFSRAWGYIRIDRNVEGIREGQIVYAHKF